MSWKNTLFGLVAVLLVLGLAELVLWVAGVRTLIDERDPFRGFSDRIRVFEPSGDGIVRTRPAAVRHSFHYEEFAATKPANGFRIFVLGGSSVYGFPWGGRVAFPYLLGRALGASWPDRQVESINAGAMSYGSHRLRILVAELLEHDPDVLVIYSGHNEFVERRFYRDLVEQGPALEGLRALLFRWRLYSALTRLLAPVAAPTPTPGAGTEQRDTGELLGLDVVRDFTAEVDEAARAEAVAKFEENIGAIVEMAARRGVPVVLCTVPSNLTGWVPNESVMPRGLDAAGRRAVERLVEEGRGALDRGAAEEALSGLAQARGLAPVHAGVHYLLGQAYSALERWDEARDAFARARDLDAQPARAVGALNESLRRLAERKRATLVDVERSFAEASPHGLPGFNLFEDYVHPKPEGHRRIARDLWQAFHRPELAGGDRTPDEAAFEGAVGELADLAASGSVHGPEAAGSAKTPQLLFNLALVLENQGRFHEAMENYRACVALDPGYYVARTNLARLLLEAGRAGDAEREYRRVLEVEPRHVRSLIGLGESLRSLHRAGEAEQAYVSATEIDPGSAAAWNGLGVLRTQLGRAADAEPAFRRADELNPGHADTLVNLGLSLLLQAKLDEADTAFRSAIEARADHVGAISGLGAVHIERGELDEAERRFRESLRIDPDDRMAQDGLAEIQRRRAAGAIESR